MLLNIYSNAIKFTGREGKISMVVKLESEKLWISVIDDGLGIKKKD